MYFAYDTIRSVCVCVGMPPLYCTKIVCIVEYSIVYTTYMVFSDLLIRKLCQSVELGCSLSRRELQLLLIGHGR